jgi:SAM-dependent methyltransferase/uncharacterized protein YbaR (Trm112 family)
VYSELLPFFACPLCHTSLALSGETRDASGEILTGQLACPACGARYPIRAGIADFLGAPSPPTPAQTTNEWPLTAWVYERGWRPFALTLLSRQPFPYRRELPLIVDLMEPARGGLYLDVACSNGLYARALARTMRGAPGHVAAFDHSLPMLEQARRYARNAGLRISFVRAEAQALPVASGQAAGVAIGGSLNEIGDVNGCLAEARRTLQPGGRFVAMTLARAESSPGRALQAALGTGGITFWTAADLAAMLRAHNLPTRTQQQYGLVMFHAAQAE